MQMTTAIAILYACRNNASIHVHGPLIQRGEVVRHLIVSSPYLFDFSLELLHVVKDLWMLYESLRVRRR
jgi:hypothetical protein